MEKFVGQASKLPVVKSSGDDDFVDRLSSRYTVIVLVVFTVLASMSTYVGKAITCWEPKHFTGSFVKYTHSYCWVRNTYYHPMDSPEQERDGPRDHIPYYQWVPFILLLQALGFYLPSAFWHGLNQKGGVDCDDILDTSHKFNGTLDLEQRKKVLEALTKQMSHFLMIRHKKQGGLHCNAYSIFRLVCSPCTTRFGNYFVILFLLSKLFYLVNVVAQLFIMNSVLATNYHIYGFEVLHYLSHGEDWTEAPGVAFPLVTFCDFDIRRLGNIHRYTVQCTLPINMYNEKIYMFLWFWMVFIAIVTAFGLIVWFLRTVISSDRKMFVRNHLQMANLDSVQEPLQDFEEFVTEYLGQDGVFILRLIAHNTSFVVVNELTVSLWKDFLNEAEKDKKEKGEGGSAGKRKDEKC